jgi:hypothetical protein
MCKRGEVRGADLPCAMLYIHSVLYYHTSEARSGRMGGKAPDLPTRRYRPWDAM